VRSDRMFCLLWAAILLLSAARSVRAQQDPNFETGIEPFKSYHGGNIDTVNLKTGGLTLDIPIISYPQRGGKLHLDFVLHYYNSGSASNGGGCWNDIDGEPQCYDGWNAPTDMPCGGSLLCHGFFLVDKDGLFLSSLGNSSFVQMPDGTTHPLELTTNSTTLPIPLASVDGSGFKYLVQSNSLPCIILDADGTEYCDDGHNSHREDVNGNKIGASSAYNSSYLGPSLGPWTDTLGRSVPAVISVPPATSGYGTYPPTGATTDFSNCPDQSTITTAWVWSPPGLSGGAYNVKFCYVEISETEPLFSTTYTGVELHGVVLPNNTTWTFNYTTDGNADLASVTFPTGGSLSYTWFQDCVAEDNPRSVSTRTLDPNDGVTPTSTWQYFYNPGYYPTCENTLQSVVRAPSSASYGATDDTSHNFDTSGYETQAKYYSGHYDTGTLLKTVNTTYQVGYAPTPYLGMGPCHWPEHTELPTSITDIWADNQQSKITMSYDNALTIYEAYYYNSTYGCIDSATMSYGRLLTKQEYDYGSGAPGSLLRTTNTSYLALSNSSYLNNNLLNLVSSVQVLDGGSTQRAYTTYSYDGSSPDSSGVSTQHDSSPPAGSYRGNLTSVARWLDTTSGYATTTNTYFDTGMVHVATDPNSNSTTYAYSSTYIGALPTTVTNALSQATALAYDFNTGLITSTTDPNSQTTTKSYDSMLRIATVSYPDGGQDSYCYMDTSSASCSSPVPSFVLTKEITSSANFVETAVVDGLGRKIHTQVNSDPSGTDYADTTYDGDGRVASVSNPHRSSSSSTDGTTYYSYDALNRVTTVTEPDTSTVQTSYSNFPCTTVTDEASRARKSCVDGAGRMTGVWEDPSGSNYETDYTYDTLNDLTGVTQGSQTRSFSYDSLSRLTTATNPESGTINYYYTTSGGSLCAGDLSAVCRRTDARSITTTYSYDALNRLTFASHSDGTPSADYTYDACSFCSAPTNNGLGRLVHVSNDVNAASTYSFDVMGRIVEKAGCVPVNCSDTAFPTTATYNLLGAVTALTYPSGRTITYTYDNAGRATSAVDTANSINYATNALYAADGSLTSLSNGAYLLSTFYYNNRLQPCRVAINSSGTAPSSCADSSHTGNVLDLAYNFNLGSSDNGKVMGITNKIDSTRSQTFTYDPLNRIATAAASTYATSPLHCWGESFTVDRYGNLTGIGSISSAYTGCTQENMSVTATTANRLTTGTTPDFSYDSAGNMTNDTVNSYAYDAENRICSVGGTSCTTGTTYIYDAKGLRMKKSSGTSYLYGLGDEVLAELDSGGSVTNEYIYFNGKRIARRDSSGNVAYYFADHLGSARVVTNSSGAIQDDSDFYPYGGERVISSSSGNTYKFTSKERDSESGLDNFGARYYSSQYGRFLTPDWAAKATALPYAVFGDPQSLNLYGYVRNDPVTMADADGHCPDPDNSCSEKKSNSARDMTVTGTYGRYQGQTYSITKARIKTVRGSDATTTTTRTTTIATFSTAENNAGQFLGATTQTSISTSDGKSLPRETDGQTQDVGYQGAQRAFGAATMEAAADSSIRLNPVAGFVVAVGQDAAQHPGKYVFAAAELASTLTPLPEAYESYEGAKAAIDVGLSAIHLGWDLTH